MADDEKFETTHLCCPESESDEEYPITSPFRVNRTHINLYIPCSLEFFELQKNRRLRLNYDSGLITPTMTPKAPKQHHVRHHEPPADVIVSGTFEVDHMGFSYWEKNYNDIIVIPSLTLNIEELKKIEGITHYEERQLFNLILLKRPQTRVIYVTSQPLDSSIVEYYWKLIPGHIPFSHIRHRLLLLSTYDGSPKPLSAKILERPRLIDRLRSCIRDPSKACLTCFNSSPYEVTLAKLLGIPLMAADIPHLFWGTKQGSRQIFRNANIPHPPGTYECIHDLDSLAQEICKLHIQNPNFTKFMIKLNEGFSGKGNAFFDLQPLLFDDKKTMFDSIREHLTTIRFCAKTESYASFLLKITEIGCIVEVFFDKAVSSPSFQACLDHSGKIILLSTHEQILDAEDHQIYQGCTFPAHKSYRCKIQEYGRKIGQELAKQGVTDHFGVDFIVVHPPGYDYDNSDPLDWSGCEIYAIEINLRQGGTTHPMMTLKLLTGGSLDEETGTFKTLQNQEKYYVASDNVHDPLFKGLLPHDIMEHFLDTHLHYDHTKQKGIVFHLLGALSQHGKIGITAIADSPEEAAHFYEQALQELYHIAKDSCSKKESINQLLHSQTQNPSV